MGNYGKVQPEDKKALKLLIREFKSKAFHCGIHGTSLWNKNYKDIDILVFSVINRSKSFIEVIENLIKKMGFKLLYKKGTKDAGLDYEMEKGNCIFHISYVILL